MKISFKKFLNLKVKAITFGILAVFALAVLLLPTPALAIPSIGDYVTEGLGKLLLIIVNFLGSYILLPLINLLVWIMGYNGFLSSRAVQVGWPLVRDISNMFFVVLLLVIAFSTILKISNYQYKNTLAKLLLMAVLVNFSKTIMGLLIDFGQVIMLTFVNAFRDAAASNLIHAFGIKDMLKINFQGGAINNWEILGTALLAVVLLVVAIGVMLAFVAVLLMRILYLWVLVILSPLAFLLSAFPMGQKYAGEFWSNFTKQLTTGVALAFFTWLALTVISAGQINETEKAALLLGGSGSAAGTAVEQQAISGNAGAISEDIQWERLYVFIIGIAMLLLALQYAGQAGGFAGSFAGKVSGKLSQYGAKAAKVVGSPLLKAAKVVGSPLIGAGALAGWGIKSIPYHLDTLSVKAQKAMGIKKQISLRPTKIKEAVARYTKERESQYYTGVSEGMTDNMMRIFSRRKSDYQGQAVDARIKEKEKEIGYSDELQEMLRSQLKQDHLETYKSKDINGNDVTKYRIKRGHEVEAKAIFHMMARNHDFNELFKDKDIGAAYNNEYNALNVRDLLRDIFDHQGEEAAAREGKSISLIGFDNKDQHLYGIGTQNVKNGKFEFFDEATKDENGDKRIIKNMGDMVEGETYEDKKNYLRKLREDAKTDKDKQIEYQRILDADWSAAQGDLATAFILKHGGRSGLGKITAQMLVNETVQRDEKTGEVITDEKGETLRSFLTAVLNRTGEGVLLNLSPALVKDYNHINDETKKYGLANSADTILKFAESERVTTPDKRSEIIAAVATICGLDKDEEFKKDLPAILQAAKQSGDGYKSLGEYDKFKEKVVLYSQEARINAHGDARHAELDEKTGKWSRKRYSVFEEEEYNRDLTSKNRNGSSGGGSGPASAAPEVKAVLNDQQIVSKLDEIERVLNNPSSNRFKKELAETQKADLIKQQINPKINTTVQNVLSQGRAEGIFNKDTNWLIDPLQKARFVTLLRNTFTGASGYGGTMSRTMRKEFSSRLTSIGDALDKADPINGNNVSSEELERLLKEFR